MELYKPFDRNNISNNKCFLCGFDLSDTNRSEEHIFPKWLQRRFNLWNQTLNILNKTRIAYKSLTIPCCLQCNGVFLAQMEEKFKYILDKGFQDMSLEEEKIVFQWASKILYATLYKESTLLADRANPKLGNIIKYEFIERFESLHLFLQSIRINTEFMNPKPWSIFVFNYKDDSFHYINDIQGLGFSMKLGRAGFTIVLEDTNQVEIFLKLMKELKRFELDSIQFLEVSARIFYAKRLARDIPKYTTLYNSGNKSMQILPLNTLNGRDWSDEDFAFFLGQLLEREGHKVNEPIYRNGVLLTTLFDEDGMLYIRKIKLDNNE